MAYKRPYNSSYDKVKGGGAFTKKPRLNFTNYRGASSSRKFPERVKASQKWDFGVDIDARLGFLHSEPVIRITSVNEFDENRSIPFSPLLGDASYGQDTIRTIFLTMDNIDFLQSNCSKIMRMVSLAATLSKSGKSNEFGTAVRFAMNGEDEKNLKTECECSGEINSQEGLDEYGACEKGPFCLNIKVTREPIIQIEEEYMHIVKHIKRQGNNQLHYAVEAEYCVTFLLSEALRFFETIHEMYDTMCKVKQSADVLVPLILETAGETMSHLLTSKYGLFTENQVTAKDTILFTHFLEVRNEYMNFGYISSLMKNVFQKIREDKIKTGYADAMSIMNHIMNQPDVIYNEKYIKCTQ